MRLPPLVATGLTAPNGDAVRVAVTLTNEDGGFEAVAAPQQFR